MTQMFVADVWNRDTRAARSREQAPDW